MNILDDICQNDFPRVTIKCKCGNEFNISVIRFKDGSPVNCQICGREFPKSLGEKLAHSLEEIYLVKHELEKDLYPFHFSFVFQSKCSQPPQPYTSDKE
jgi:hypothetical protein